MPPIIPVDAATASPQQLLIVLLEQSQLVADRLTALENAVTQLTESVTSLQGAVDGVAARLLGQVQALQTALDTARADDAVAAALSAEVDQAVAGINTEIDKLNALGADPSTPVDPGNASNPEPTVETSADPGDEPTA